MIVPMHLTLGLRKTSYSEQGSGKKGGMMENQDIGYGYIGNPIYLQGLNPFPICPYPVCPLL
jgi:hypothetical protein